VHVGLCFMFCGEEAVELVIGRPDLEDGLRVVEVVPVPDFTRHRATTTIQIPLQVIPKPSKDNSKTYHRSCPCSTEIIPGSYACWWVNGGL